MHLLRCRWQMQRNEEGGLHLICPRHCSSDPPRTTGWKEKETMLSHECEEKTSYKQLCHSGFSWFFYFTASVCADFRGGVWAVSCTWLYLRALLKTAVLVPSNPTPRVSSIILLLLLITPSVSWLEPRAWIAAPKLSVIPWGGERGQQKEKIQTKN